MIINLSPVRLPVPLTLSRAGDVLTLNGVEVDLSVIPDGASLPASAIDSPWFSELVERIDGVLHVTLLLPCGPSAPHATRYPEPITLAGDGVVPLPPYGATNDSD